MPTYKIMVLSEPQLEKLIGRADPLESAREFISVCLSHPGIGMGLMQLCSVNIPADDKMAPKEMRGRSNVPAICTYATLEDFVADTNRQEVYFFAKSVKRP